MLAVQGVALAESAHGGHVPMDANPVERWTR